MTPKAQVFDLASQMKQYRIMCYVITCIILLGLLCFAIWYETIYKAEASWFREAKMVVEEEDLVEKAIPTSTKYKN